VEGRRLKDLKGPDSQTLRGRRRQAGGQYLRPMTAARDGVVLSANPCESAGIKSSHVEEN
jgi:hypothetical protein